MQRRALQSFSGISMQRTSRDCATKAVYNTKFKCESRKGICRPTFRQRGLGQLNLFTSLSRRAGKLQEGHLESEQKEEVIQNTEVRLFILRQSIQLESHTSLYSLLFIKTQMEALCAGSHQEMQVPFWVPPQCKPLSKHTLLKTLHMSPLLAQCTRTIARSQMIKRCHGMEVKIWIADFSINKIILLFQKQEMPENLQLGLCHRISLSK